ncbi:MAG: DegT/DnrJ/EryC1/StrS family aminotransferase, partial [Planctomycetota bacterium]
DNDDLADTCVSLRNQGRSAGAGWLSHERLGYNFRLSDINCALGIVQLSRLKEIKAKRKQVAQWYQEILGNDQRLIIPKEPDGCDISWFVFVVRLAEAFSLAQRDAILDSMRASGIQVSNYFPPVLSQPFMIERFGDRSGEFAIADAVCRSTIALPFYNNLGADEVSIVCEELKAALNQVC